MEKIPELLVSLSGKKIENQSEWETFRRREILNLFEQYVYGVRDIEKPDGLTFKVTKDSTVNGMRCKEIEGSFNNYIFPFSLYLPLEQKSVVPAFVFAQHEFMHRSFVPDEKGNLINRKGGLAQIPLKDITDRGFAIAIIPNRYIYRDWEAKESFKQGVFASYDSPKDRQGNSWASISAWAWGASRVMDYLETDRDIDCQNVAVIGHSRGGKTALWAAATDHRFRLAISNNSGCMGAAVLRGKEGEHIKDINITDWFCENFKDFNEHEDMLPVDQHMLLALIAPRPVYVASSVLDTWADPKAEYLSCHMASEVYELYGLKGLVAPEGEPQLEVPFHEGSIAYHMKSGGHSITAYDWKNYMDYFEKNII